jgi:hypothetical protein
MVSQGRRERLTRRNSPILGVVRVVSPAAERLPGSRDVWKQATARCGSATAGRSWAVFIIYGPSVISSVQTSFVVKTARGWRVY